MKGVRGLALAGALAMAVAWPRLAGATVSIAPSPSYNGSFTVSWTDPYSGPNRAYLMASFNGGAWSKTRVLSASTAFTGKAVGAYAYKIALYVYDAETHAEWFEYETNVATVQVTTTAPGIPGAVVAPEASITGSYEVSWGPAASGVAVWYELQENGSTAYSGASRKTTLSGRTNGTYSYAARACNAIGCSPYTASKSVTVDLSLTELVPDAVVQSSAPPPRAGWAPCRAAPG